MYKFHLLYGNKFKPGDDHEIESLSWFPEEYEKLSDNETGCEIIRDDGVVVYLFILDDSGTPETERFPLNWDKDYEAVYDLSKKLWSGAKEGLQ